VTLTIERYDDVTRLRMSSVASRAFGLDVSAYLIRGVLIDTGFTRVRQQFAGALDGLEVRGAIVTHWHEDHAGNVELLARRGVPIAVRADTLEVLRRRPAIRMYRVATWGRPPALRSSVTAFDPAPLEVIHTPGHSADHQVVWDPETRTVFSGDLWLGVRVKAMHPTEDPYETVASLRRLAALEPVRMFDAHRGVVRDPATALRAKADWMEETTAVIELGLADGWSVRRVVREVLGGEEGAAWVSGGEYSRRSYVLSVARKSLAPNA
jgi:glyoxylase-like metal-dependent hydrolase (beta-lactamase superfamily II)